MKIEVNDLLVFEDKDGNIYQDCVLSIVPKSCCLMYEDIYIKTIYTALFEVCINKNEEVDRIFARVGILQDVEKSLNLQEIAKTLKLKEVWNRVDEDTYKKVYVWSYEFNQMIPYVKGYIERKVNGSK